MRKTIRRPDSEWRKLIEEFRNSGLTMYKWCTKEGISTTTFRRKLELVPTDVAEGKMKSAMSENFLEENAAVINDSSCGDVVSAETRDAESLEHEELMDGIMLGVKEKTGSSKNRLLPELGVISRSCKSLYFVDTENMSGEPIACLLKGIDDSSKALLFYTKKSNYISYEVLGTFFEKRDQISLIACDCGTDNALDFQLVSVLGSLISDFMNKGLDSDIPELIIVSKDHGFDAVIKFWKLRGIN